LIEQLVCFIQYVDRAGCPTIQFLFTADLLKESDSADAATIVKVIQEKLEDLGIDIRKLRSIATDGASTISSNFISALNLLFAASSLANQYNEVNAIKSTSDAYSFLFLEWRYFVYFLPVLPLCVPWIWNGPV
jgi:hypothetical protein